MDKPAIVSHKKSLASISPLQLYLQEIAKYPLLEPEEEYELAKKHFEESDVASAHRLVTSNLRLVVKIANDFRRSQTNFLDLVQEGNHGLLVAVKKFNPYKGVKLSSYAAWWIRAYILKYLLDNKSQVKIATTSAQRKLFYNLQKEVDRLLGQYDRVDPSEIARRLNVPEKDVLEMQKRLSSSDVSLDKPVTDEAHTTRADFLVDDKESLEDSLVNRQIKSMFEAHLHDFVATLSGRDLDIFQQRLLSDTPCTLQELGHTYGITRERARQIEAQLLKKLKKFVSDRGLLESDTIK